MVHDWSCAQYPLNAMLVNPPVEYGTLGDFLCMLSPGAYMGGGGPAGLLSALDGGPRPPPLAGG